MKMEQTACSETSAYKIRTPGNYAKESIQHTEHGESLKLRIDLYIHSFLTLLLDGGEWSDSPYGRFTRGNILHSPFDTRPCGFQKRSESLEERKNFFPPPEMNQPFFVFRASSLVTTSTELTWLPYLSTSNTKFPLHNLCRSLKSSFH